MPGGGAGEGVGEGAGEGVGGGRRGVVRARRRRWKILGFSDPFYTENPFLECILERVFGLKELPNPQKFPPAAACIHPPTVKFAPQAAENVGVFGPLLYRKPLPGVHSGTYFRPKRASKSTKFSACGGRVSTHPRFNLRRRRARF